MRTVMLLVALLVMLLMISAFPIGLDEAEAAPMPIPITTVTLDVDILEVRVHPYSPSVAIITGSVSVEKCGCERVTVELTHDLDVGWPVRIEPSIIPFINPADEPFRVIMIVPPGHHPLEGKITITGIARSPGLGPNYGTDDCLIRLSPFHLSRLEVIGSPCVVGEDGEARFPVRVWNLGTAEDILLLDLLPRDLPLEDREGPLNVLVPPRSFVELDITIRYDEPSGPAQIWSTDLILSSSWSNTANTSGDPYVGGPSSRELMVYDDGSAIGQLTEMDMVTVFTVLVIQSALIISLVALRRKTSLARIQGGLDENDY